MKNSSIRKLKILFLIIVIIIIIFSLVFYIINNQQQRTVKEMANKILSSAEYYAISQMMDGNVKDVIVKFPDNNLLDIRGKLPKTGYVKITADSRIEILYYYNGYCVSKSFDEFDNSFKKMNEEECLTTKN